MKLLDQRGKSKRFVARHHKDFVAPLHRDLYRRYWGQNEKTHDSQNGTNALRSAWERNLFLFMDDECKRTISFQTSWQGHLTPIHTPCPHGFTSSGTGSQGNRHTGPQNDTIYWLNEHGITRTRSNQTVPRFEFGLNLFMQKEKKKVKLEMIFLNTVLSK